MFSSSSPPFSLVPLARSPSSPTPRTRNDWNCSRRSEEQRSTTRRRQSPSRRSPAPVSLPPLVLVASCVSHPRSMPSSVSFFCCAIAEAKKAKMVKTLEAIESRLEELEEEKGELKEFQEKDRDRKSLEYAIFSKELEEISTTLESVSRLLALLEVGLSGKGESEGESDLGLCLVALEQMEQERAENMNDSNARRQEFIKREKIIQVRRLTCLILFLSRSDLFVASLLSETGGNRLVESPTALAPRHLVPAVRNRDEGPRPFAHGGRMSNRRSGLGCWTGGGEEEEAGRRARGCRGEDHRSRRRAGGGGA